MDGLGRAYGGSGPEEDASAPSGLLESDIVAVNFDWSLDSLAACASTQGKLGGSLRPFCCGRSLATDANAAREAL